LTPPFRSPRLVRSEIALAKTELATKAKHAGIGIGMLVVGGVLVLYGLGFLLHSAMEGLATVMPLWLAALIVGLARVLVAGTLAVVGVQQLQRGVPPTPTGAVEGIKEDVATIKEGLRS